MRRPAELDDADRKRPRGAQPVWRDEHGNPLPADISERADRMAADMEARANQMMARAEELFGRLGEPNPKFANALAPELFYQGRRPDQEASSDATRMYAFVSLLVIIAFVVGWSLGTFLRS